MIHASVATVRRQRCVRMNAWLGLGKEENGSSAAGYWKGCTVVPLWSLRSAKDMVRSASLLVLALIAGSAARAQEHPFIAAYTLTELDGGIRVGWTIQGGSTCNGQDVERSTDGVDFVQVHRIEGICGTPSAAVLYDWFDAAPPELSTVFYSIKLGLDGYSSVKSIHFAQLNTSDQRFYPSPMEGSGTLVLDLPLTKRWTCASWTPQGIWSSSGSAPPARPSPWNCPQWHPACTATRPSVAAARSPGAS